MFLLSAKRAPTTVENVSLSLGVALMGNSSLFPSCITSLVLWFQGAVPGVGPDPQDLSPPFWGTPKFIKRRFLK